MAMCRFRSLYGDETSAGDLRPKIRAATDSIKHLLAVYGVVLTLTLTLTLTLARIFGRRSPAEGSSP